MDIELIANLITEEPDIMDSLLSEAVLTGDHDYIEAILEQMKRWLTAAASAKKKSKLEQEPEQLVEIAKSLDPTATEKKPYFYVDWILKIMKPGGEFIITDEEDRNRLTNALIKYEKYKLLSKRAKKSIEMHGEAIPKWFREFVGEHGGKDIGDLTRHDLQSIAHIDPNINSYRSLPGLEEAVLNADIAIGVAPAEHDVDSGIKDMQFGDFKLVHGAKWVAETPRLALLRLSSPEALYHYSQGHVWCTHGLDQAKSYIRSYGPQYMILVKPKTKDDAWDAIVLFQSDFGQFEADQRPGLQRQQLSVSDKLECPIASGTIDHNPLTGPYADEIRELVRPSESDIYDAPDKYIRYAVAKGEQIPEHLASEIIKNPSAAAEYAQIYLKHRWPEAEPYILQDLNAAMQYGSKVLMPSLGLEGTRKILAPIEPQILKDPPSIVTYAVDILNHRVPELEPAILKDINQAVRYFIHFKRDFNGEWKDLTDKAISSNDPWGITRFARDVVEGPVPSKEDIILKNLPAAVEYYTNARNYGRHSSYPAWPELEQKLVEKGRADLLYKYAIARGERWPEEIERIIVGSPDVANEYYTYFVIRSKFLNNRWMALEEKLLTDGSPDQITAYALHLSGRWPEAEPLIALDGNTAIRYAERVGRFPLGDKLFLERGTDIALDYMKAAKRGRSRQTEKWPDLERLIKDDAETAYKYADITDRRFVEGEDAIAQDIELASIYLKKFASDFKGQVWPAYIKTLLKHGDDTYAVIYSSITGHVPDVIVQSIESPTMKKLLGITIKKTKKS